MKTQEKKIQKQNIEKELLNLYEVIRENETNQKLNLEEIRKIEAISDQDIQQFNIVFTKNAILTEEIKHLFAEL